MRLPSGRPDVETSVVDAPRLPKTLRGELLRAFAMSPGRKHLSVIVAPKTSKPSGVPVAFWQPSPADKRALRRDLQRLGLADRARKLAAVGEFVLEVTPKQLLRLAALDSVQAIRPNLFRHRLVNAA